MGAIVSVNVVHALIPDVSGDLDRTAIDKRPVDREVIVGVNGLVGDHSYDTRHHGGPDQAVYAYAREHYDAWEVELGRTLTNGCFGDNLTTTDLDVTGAVVGETWRIGDRVVLRARSPRMPCRTFAGFIGEPQWVKRFTTAGNPGTYFAVVTEGRIAPGDRVEVVDRPSHGATIGDVFAVLSGDRDGDRLARLRSAYDDMPAELRTDLGRLIG